LSRGNLNEAEEMYMKAEEMNPGNEWIRLTKRQFFPAAGAHVPVPNEGPNRYFFYGPKTRYNYYRIVTELQKRNIKVICVEYPMRPAAELRGMMKAFKGIVFVDNEKSFKESVGREGYDAFFRDRFAGHFGHCTDKGNMLLASNIAEAILKLGHDNRK
jgi:hypothetical protein